MMQPLTLQSRIELVRRIEVHCRQVLDEAEQRYYAMLEQAAMAA